MWNLKQQINYCILQILEKKWKYSEAEHQLFIDFKMLMIQLGGGLV